MKQMIKIIVMMVSLAIPMVSMAETCPFFSCFGAALGIDDIQNQLNSIQSSVDHIDCCDCAATPIFNDSVSTITLSEPGNYCLAENISLTSDAPVLVIASHNVTLNLNSFSVTNNGTGDAISTEADFGTIIIKNGSAQGGSNGAGINDHGSVFITIDSIRFNAGQYGIFAAKFGGMAIKNVVSTGATTAGAAIGDTGAITIADSVFIFSPVGCSLENGVAGVRIDRCFFGGGTAGLSIDAASGDITISDSGFFGNTTGLSITAGGGIRVENSVFRGNATGVSVSNGASCIELTNCSASAGSNTGFIFDNATDVIVRDCFACSCEFDGFNATNGSSNLCLIGCTAQGNANGFDFVSTSSSLIQGCRAIGNRLGGAGNGYGFKDDGSGDNQYYANVACDNLVAGYSPAITAAFVVTSPANARGVDNIDCASTDPNRDTVLASKIDILLTTCS